MLKYNYVKLKTKGLRKIKYFKSIGYDVSKDFIDIKIPDLNPGSRILIDVICDYCGDEKKIPYKEYLRNIEIGGKYACSKKCGTEKAKENNLKKIGVLHSNCLDVNQNKIKQTNLKKWGVEYPMQNLDIKEKSKQTLLKKYNEQHISKTDFYKNKIKQTNLKKWGVEYPMQNLDIKEKSKQTLLKNWGVTNPSKSIKILNKIKQTNLKKYGDELYLKSEDYKNKNKKTLSVKWHSDNIMKSEIFRNDRFLITKDNNYIKYDKNGVSVFKCDKGIDHDFKIKNDVYFKRKKLNIPLCTTCNPVNKENSIKEKEFYEFIKNVYDGEVLRRYRGKNKYEIDVYLPGLKIGFEFNGLYWHTEKYRNKYYHLEKLSYFKQKNIRIFYIWEDDWMFKNNIVKSQAKNWLNLSENKIGARECKVREIDDVKLVRNFLNNNHIQGFTSSSKKIGLFYNDNLISLMTFDHSEGRKKLPENEWNLSRFCNKIDFNVIGGASKLLNFFVKKYSVRRIISYADKDWSNGNLYLKLGFVKISDIKPDYKYLIESKREHKSKFRKSNLNINISEKQFMDENNIQRIWDCGRIKFEKYFK